jgi:hypothetical protein
VGQSPSPSSLPSGVSLETGWDDRGFATTRTIISGGASKSYDQQGFVITATPTTSGIAGAVVSTPGVCFGQNCGPGNKIVGTSTSTAAAARQTSAWGGMAVFGIVAAVAERLLL